MFSQLLSVINLPENATFGDKLIVGLEIAAIGIFVVFAMLAVLVLVTTLFKKLIYDKSLKKQTSSADNAVAALPAPVVVSDAVAMQSDDMPIAAITAALNAMLSEENANSDVKFVVRSIKKF